MSLQPAHGSVMNTASDALDCVARRGWAWSKRQRGGGAADVDAVENQDVVVTVEVQTTAKALNLSNRSALRGLHPSVKPLFREDRLDEEPPQLSENARIERREPSQLVGQR